MGVSTIDHWTVDYGNGPVACNVPHAWRQDVPVTWEGPAIYQTRVEVPIDLTTLRFEGVSYRAEVLVNGDRWLVHHGIWDAFDLDLAELAGQTIDLEVRVVKNGGTTFPVRDVLSGFLPYVFHTFGGIFRPVRWVSDSTQPQRDSRVEVRGSQIWADGKPFYVRGILHWGWYPELGHCHPDRRIIQQEILACRNLGFNLFKFCLWVPPHDYLDVLAEYDMWAWMELPLWDPSDNPDQLETMAQEIERIVLQYRHHRNIMLWTAGCELSDATPPEFRQRVVQMIEDHTGSPLVRDNSGGAEMYGGSLREFGAFWDFHPYCDTPFFPEVLDSLRPGPRPNQPVLLGEFDDIDVDRDFTRLRRERPYWASSDPSLNDQGVRWQYDLPSVLEHSRLAVQTDADRLEASIMKAAFMREWVQQEVAARDWIGGFVVTGMRDTPISTSGFFDDFGHSRFWVMTTTWNAPNVFFRIPHRHPPWVRGGNRPGWRDTANFWEGECSVAIGLFSELGGEFTGRWWVERTLAKVCEGTWSASLNPLTSAQIAQIELDLPSASYWLWLESEARRVAAAWNLEIWPKTEWPDETEFRSHAEDLPDPWTFGNLTVFRSGPLVRSMPFWRESAYDYPVDSPTTRMFKNRWHRLLSVSGDVAFDEEALGKALPNGYEVLMRRIDTRTYRSNPVVVRHAEGVWTTLRPFGGLGRQPSSLSTNPFGAHLALALAKLAL